MLRNLCKLKILVTGLWNCPLQRKESAMIWVRNGDYSRGKNWEGDDFILWGIWCGERDISHECCVTRRSFHLWTVETTVLPLSTIERERAYLLSGVL